MQKIQKHVLGTLPRRRTLDTDKPRRPKQCADRLLSHFLANEGRLHDLPAHRHYARVLRSLRGTPCTLVGPLNRQVKLCARRRGFGSQGSYTTNAPVLCRLLFEWFCDIRSTVAGRLPLHRLHDQAVYIRKQLLTESAKQGLPVSLPQIAGTNWLWRFRKQYNISLRRPNKRWKVPRAVLMERLKIMWTNAISCLLYTSDAADE